MTGKERLLTAFRNKQPDMVPIAPDIDLIGMRWWSEKIKKPWWNVFLYEEPSFREVYIEANKKLGCEVWDYFGSLYSESSVEIKKEIIEKDPDKIIQKIITKTPYGDLDEVIIYPSDKPPWQRNMIKNIHKEWPKIRWVLEQRKFYPKINISPNLGNHGAIGIGLATFPDFLVKLRGSERAILDLYDYQELIDEIFEFYHQYVIDFTKICIKAKPEVICTGGSSSSLSLISPQIFCKYSLPTIKEVTRCCKESGVLTHCHICGKSRELIEIIHKETYLNIMEPLECPPTGNVDLKEVKKRFGDKLCLKGNINIVLLLESNPKDIKDSVKKAINDAGENGGFVLSTGDSPGANTPDKNIYIMVEAGREYGRY